MDLQKTQLFNNQPAVLTSNRRVLLSLFPEEREVEVAAMEGEEPTTEKQTYAWQVWVDKPLTRAAAINACEQEAYGLKSAMEVASYGASLARKARLGEDTDEVSEHDAFIESVKKELTRIGVK